MILVTGANGWSGSAVIREFARRQTPVRALVRSRARARGLETLGDVELMEGDMRRPETLEGALRGVERALMISSSDPQMAETQRAFVDAAKKAGVRHIVKFSGKESGAGFDAKRFRFTRMHEEIEAHLEGSGLAWTHLRPSQFMQVYLREAPSIVSSGALALPLEEDASLSPVDLEDVAKVAFALLNEGGHEGRSYEMTGPEALTMAEVARRISEAIGKTVRYVNVTDAERRQALLGAGTPPYFADALDEQARERRRCRESRVHLDTHEAFGARPTTFADFARRNAAVFRGDAALPQG